MLSSGRRRPHRADCEQGFTIIEVMISTSVLLLVLAMLFSSLVSLTRNEDRSQRLVSNEQNVRFELDQLAREIRAANPLVPLLNASTASTYDNQIEMVLGPTGGTQTVVRWTYDTVKEQMVRQLMSGTSATATVLAQSFFLARVRNIENGIPVFTYYGQHNEDLVKQSLATADPLHIHDAANCAIRIHIDLSSDSNPGPLPFTQTQDVEVRNRLPGNVGCG